jgi:hypothetical protein
MYVIRATSVHGNLSAKEKFVKYKSQWATYKVQSKAICFGTGARSSFTSLCPPPQGRNFSGLQCSPSQHIMYHKKIVKTTVEV